MKIYTRKGDDGNTSLAGGQRVPKYDLHVDACGSVDELISWIGLLRSFRENGERISALINIQDQLMKCASVLATEKKSRKSVKCLPEPVALLFLEEEIDKMSAKLPERESFIIPGGNVLVSYCDITRSVCRRAERTVLKLNSTEDIPDIIYKYLNRLSDFLFLLSRIISLELDNKEINWPV